MSFSINDLPSIKIPNSLPTSNPYLIYVPTSNQSNLSNISEFEAITPPTACTNSPSHSSKHHPYTNIFSPSMDTSSPRSTSYTINTYNTSNIIMSPSTPTSSNKNLSEIICNTPNTINNILASRNKYKHKRIYNNNNNHSAHSSNASLQLSETPLTPTPKQDITFNFNCVDDSGCESETQTQKHINTQNTINNNINNGTFKAPITNKTLHVLIESDDKIDTITDYINNSKSSDEDSKESKEEEEDINNIITEDELSEKICLKNKGYIKIKKITDTLQGSVFTCNNNNNKTGDGNSIVVIKRCSKYLHNKGVTIQNGKEYPVNENVINEYKILKHFTAQKLCPSQITKSIDFFESEYNYYVVMENAGSDFFDFIVRAHNLINDGKLKIKEWRKFVKYLFYQMVIVVQFLHSQMHCCHLDISLENITVLNGDFIINSDGYYTISNNIKIKFVDFGLAEFYDPNDKFECVKYCGKTAYKSPEIYRAKRIFDARKADIWSLGVVLFCMAVGSPPYIKPSNSDDAYKYFIKTGHIEKLLFQWNRHLCVTVKMLDLLKNMLKVDTKKRYLIENVLKHSWLSVYQKQYKSTYNQISKQKNNINVLLNEEIPIYKLPFSKQND